MKSCLLSFVLFLLFGFSASSHVLAQTTYTSRPGGGAWSDPNTWLVSGAVGAPSVPASSTIRQGESNNIIVITSPVRLDTDYTIGGDEGILTINAGGSLIEDAPGRRLSFGAQQSADRLRLVLNGTLQVTSLSFNKADAEINASLRTSCNISVENQSTLTVSDNVTIAGNLIVRQGNPSIEGAGQLNISCCVLSNNNGSLNGLFGPNLRVCVQGLANTCDTEGLSCNPRVAQAITIDGCRQPLPVELLSFTARGSNGVVELQWSTATERNSASFLVERSSGGYEFEPVTSVPAAGTSHGVRSYSARDQRPLTGISYYRLKQIDQDGSFSYSPVMSVQVAGIDKQNLSAYSSNGRLNVEMNTPAVCQTLRILDNMGRLVYTKELPAGTISNVLREVPLRGIGSGAYIVQAVTTQGTISRRFMVVE